MSLPKKCHLWGDSRGCSLLQDCINAVLTTCACAGQPEPAAADAPAASAAVCSAWCAAGTTAADAAAARAAPAGAAAAWRSGGSGAATAAACGRVAGRRRGDAAVWRVQAAGGGHLGA